MKMKNLHEDWLVSPQNAPTRSLHAPTIAQSNQGNILAAWVGGSFDGAKDTQIWFSISSKEKWSSPAPADLPLHATEKLEPTWNPVLVYHPERLQWWLFIKMGDHPRNWRNLLFTSSDGVLWKRHDWPEQLMGPTRNPPLYDETDSSWLLPSSHERGLVRWISMERYHENENRGSHCHVQRTEASLIQPALLDRGDSCLVALCRSRKGFIYRTDSDDRGEHWSKPRPTTLPNPDSAIAAINLQQGGYLLVYNQKGRNRLSIAYSQDSYNWQTLKQWHSESTSMAYPTLIETLPGQIKMLMSVNRRSIGYVGFTIGAAASLS